MKYGKRHNRRGAVRKKSLKTEWILMWILAGLLVVAVLLFIRSRSSRTSGNQGAGEKMSTESETFKDKVSEETESIKAGTDGAGTDEAGTGDVIADDQSAADEAPAQTIEPEQEESAGPEPVRLENLSGLKPGTVLKPEQIDFDNPERYFMSWEIEEGDNLYERINGKSYRLNKHVPLSSLRYLKMPHYNFDGQIQVGEMIINKDIQEDVFSIFGELFEMKYQIQSMYLVDNYWTGDPETSDSESIDDNNTSAFCYREISGGGNLSNHAYGRAIDLNPQQNPYVSYSKGSPKWYHSNADDYIARDTGLPHVITHEDPAYRLFTKYGFRWGGDWSNPKDYQHFDKNK